MTAVRRAWRGRGSRRALKRGDDRAGRSTTGSTALETGNDVDNAPMRAVNARLGYQPLPDELDDARTARRSGRIRHGRVDRAS